MDELREAAIALDRAVKVEGVSPRYHREQVARLKREWPALWRAIEQVQRSI